MPDVVIASAVRLPTGRFLGALAECPATALGALVVREAVRRAEVEPAAVDECIMGQVLTAGAGQAPARQAALRGGLPDQVAALTINKVCGSGLKAVMLGAQAIFAGDAEIVVAGGMESMSQAPYVAPRVREGLRHGHGTLVDSLVADGLWCAFEQSHMGEAAERVAERCGVSREQQDAYAADSHHRAAAAWAAGWFDAECLPVDLPRERRAPVALARDEAIRPDTTVEALSALRPAFRAGGSVTAGNAPPLSDGAAALVLVSDRRAAALVLRPLARIVGQATSGLAPADVLLTPVSAIDRLVSRIGWPLASVDLLEINEAFSAQMVALRALLPVDPQRVNVQGGAVALGHPIGASGARILVTLLHALARQGLRRGIASLCLGGGNGVALAVERL
jgi:acetyl-CoA C-acetyltransferase